jgi:hypothetical protein
MLIYRSGLQLITTGTEATAAEAAEEAVIGAEEVVMDTIKLPE